MMGALANEVRLNREALNALPPKALIEVVRVATGGFRAGFADVGRFAVLTDEDSGYRFDVFAFSMMVGDRRVLWSMENDTIGLIEVRRADLCQESQLRDWLCRLTERRTEQCSCVSGLTGPRSVATL